MNPNSTIRLPTGRELTIGQFTKLTNEVVRQTPKNRVQRGPVRAITPAQEQQAERDRQHARRQHQQQQERRQADATTSAGYDSAAAQGYAQALAKGKVQEADRERLAQLEGVAASGVWSTKLQAEMHALRRDISDRDALPASIPDDPKAKAEYEWLTRTTAWSASSRESYVLTRTAELSGTLRRG